jgi:hypothetical protein
MPSESMLGPIPDRDPDPKLTPGKELFGTWNVTPSLIPHTH